MQNYLLWFFAFGFQLGVYVSGPLTLVNTATFVGAILGTLCVLSISAAKSINGWLGLLSAVCYAYASYNAKNYLGIFEQIAYVVTLDLPILFAVKTWGDDTAGKLRSFGKKQWIIAIIATLAIYVVAGYLIGQFTPDPRPWQDSIAFSISLVAGVITFMRYNSAYYWWTASGIAQMVLWYSTYMSGDSSLAMAVVSLTYLANDVLAFTISPWFNRGRKKAGLDDI